MLGSSGLLGFVSSSSKTGPDTDGDLSGCGAVHQVTRCGPPSLQGYHIWQRASPSRNCILCQLNHFVQIAGMASKVFEHPFDLTKVRLQSQLLDSTARFDGPIDCLVKTWRNEGIPGLYRVSSLFFTRILMIPNKFLRIGSSCTNRWSNGRECIAFLIVQ